MHIYFVSDTVVALSISGNLNLKGWEMDIEQMKKLAQDNLSVVVPSKFLLTLMDESEALKDWIEKTNWVQSEKIGRPGDHRADALTTYAMRLLGGLTLAEEALNGAGFIKNDEDGLWSPSIPKVSFAIPESETKLHSILAAYRNHHIPANTNIDQETLLRYLMEYIEHMPQHMPVVQPHLMMYDPAHGTGKPFPSHAAQYRKWHGTTAWLYNPWTGDKRSPLDIGSDVHGLLIVSVDSADAKEGA